MQNWCNERVMVLGAVVGLSVPAHLPGCPCSAAHVTLEPPLPAAVMLWQGWSPAPRPGRGPCWAGSRSLTWPSPSPGGARAGAASAPRCPGQGRGWAQAARPWGPCQASGDALTLHLRTAPGAGIAWLHHRAAFSSAKTQTYTPQPDIFTVVFFLVCFFVLFFKSTNLCLKHKHIRKPTFLR